MNNRPPIWADKILQWYCRKDKLEDLQGDLYECYTRNIDLKGQRKARLIYVLDVLKFLRIYTIKKLKTKGTMNSFQLLENYWKTSVRSIARNKLFSGINVVGLAISMSVGILMIVFVSELLSYDNFHDKGDRIYRIIASFEGINNQGDPSNLDLLHLSLHQVQSPPLLLHVFWLLLIKGLSLLCLHHFLCSWR